MYFAIVSEKYRAYNDKRQQWIFYPDEFVSLAWGIKKNEIIFDITGNGMMLRNSGQSVSSQLRISHSPSTFLFSCAFFFPLQIISCCSLSWVNKLVSEACEYKLMHEFDVYFICRKKNDMGQF